MDEKAILYVRVKDIVENALVWENECSLLRETVEKLNKQIEDLKAQNEKLMKDIGVLNNAFDDFCRILER